MKHSIKLWATGLIGGSCLFLSSCIKMEEKMILNPDNSGKVRITFEMPDMSAMMGGLGDLGADADVEMPDAEELAKEFAKGVLGGTQGVEAWRDVEWGKTAEGKMRFQGVAYFKDVNEFQTDTGAGDGAGGGGMNSEMRDGKWVISMSMDDGEAAADEPAGEPVPADQIDAVLQQQRAQWQAMKGMMLGMFAELNIEYRLKLSGEIESVSNFEQFAPNVAGVTIDGQKMIAGMEKMMMDDEFMKKALAEGKVGEDGMPEPPPE
ncbi:MAG: hypothetical protein AAF585_14830, partial [Verrucomicrobiota bacterium]